MKYAILAAALAAGLALAGCDEKPIATKSTNNPTMAVDLLFTVDGCRVYRFYYNADRFFASCPGGSTYNRPAGKTSTPEEIGTAGRASGTHVDNGD